MCLDIVSFIDYGETPDINLIGQGRKAFLLETSWDVGTTDTKVDLKLAQSARLVQ